MTVERDEAVTRVTRRLSRRGQARFSDLLRAAQRAARVREDALFDVGLAWTGMRRGALELGSRLARARAIPAAEDVFSNKGITRPIHGFARIWQAASAR